MRWCRWKGQYAAADWRRVWFKNETQWKNFTRGRDWLSRTLSFSAPSKAAKTCICCSFYPSNSCSPPQPRFPPQTFLGVPGWPHCGSLILSLDASFAALHRKYTVRSVVKWHWSGTQINFISFKQNQAWRFEVLFFLDLYDFIVTRCDFATQTKGFRGTSLVPRQPDGKLWCIHLKNNVSWVRIRRAAWKISRWGLLMSCLLIVCIILY